MIDNVISFEFAWFVFALIFIELQSTSNCNFLNSFRSKTVRRSYITFKHFALEIVGVDIVIYVSLQN